MLGKCSQAICPAHHVFMECVWCHWKTWILQFTPRYIIRQGHFARKGTRASKATIHFHPGFVSEQERPGSAALLQVSNVFVRSSLGHMWCKSHHTADSSPPEAAPEKRTVPSFSTWPYPSCSKSLWRVSSIISSITSGFKISLI